MLVFRWQASVQPTREQLKSIYLLEGLKPEEETMPPGSEVEDHKHPFDEFRVIVEGELMMSISGNKLVLRPGDRILIPSNTRHSMSNTSEESCVSFCAHRAY